MGEVETWAALPSTRGEPLRASHARSTPPAPPPRQSSVGADTAQVIFLFIPHETIKMKYREHLIFISSKYG